MEVAKKMGPTSEPATRIHGQQQPSGVCAQNCEAEEFAIESSAKQARSPPHGYPSHLGPPEGLGHPQRHGTSRKCGPRAAVRPHLALGPHGGPPHGPRACHGSHGGTNPQRGLGPRGRCSGPHDPSGEAVALRISGRSRAPALDGFSLRDALDAPQLPAGGRGKCLNSTWDLAPLFEVLYRKHFEILAPLPEVLYLQHC